jgi:hypothetical protein
MSNLEKAQAKLVDDILEELAVDEIRHALRVRSPITTEGWVYFEDVLGAAPPMPPARARRALRTLESLSLVERRVGYASKQPQWRPVGILDAIARAANAP